MMSMGLLSYNEYGTTELCTSGYGEDGITELCCLYGE